MQARWRSPPTQARARDAGKVTDWEASGREMSEREAEHFRRGRWRGGPRTLLAAMNVQHLGLMMTAGLGWLLRPDGHHGLGDRMLPSLASRVGLRSAADVHRVRLVLEEQRDQTRADLLVYGPSWTIVVEAKT